MSIKNKISVEKESVIVLAYSFMYDEYLRIKRKRNFPDKIKKENLEWIINKLRLFQIIIEDDLKMKVNFINRYDNEDIKRKDK